MDIFSLVLLCISMATPALRHRAGGIAGLMPGELPSILQRGEVVLPKGSNQTSTPINVAMHISTPDANSFRASQAQIEAEAARGIRRDRRYCEDGHQQGRIG